MVPTLMKLPNARKVVQLLGGTRAGTDVLIVYDPFTATNTEPLAIAVTEVGGSLTMMQMMQGGIMGAS